MSPSFLVGNEGSLEEVTRNMISLFISSRKALQPWGRLPNSYTIFVTSLLFSGVPHCSLILSSHANCLWDTYTTTCGHLHSSLTTWSILLISQGHFWILQLCLTCTVLRHPGWKICLLHISRSLLRSKIIPSDIQHCRRTFCVQTQKYMSKIENPYPKAHGFFSPLHALELCASLRTHVVVQHQLYNTHLRMAGLSTKRCSVIPSLLIWPT